MATVAGLFETRADAEVAVKQLQANGIDRGNIGIAMQDKAEMRDAAETTGTNAGTATAAGAVTGGLLGGGLGQEMLAGAEADFEPGLRDRRGEQGQRIERGRLLRHGDADARQPGIDRRLARGAQRPAEPAAVKAAVFLKFVGHGRTINERPVAWRPAVA